MSGTVPHSPCERIDRTRHGIGKEKRPDAAELLRVREFCRTLEGAVANLPDDVRAALYRPCAEACVKGSVLEEQRRQFLECGSDLDRQYVRYGRSAYFFADVVEPGRVYEGLPRCLCPQVAAGFVETPAHCECSRQSILYVLRELLPGGGSGWRRCGPCFRAGGECRFRVTVG